MRDHRKRALRQAARLHLITNSNYFGNLSELKLPGLPKPLLQKTGDAGFEELTCLGYNPASSILAAVVRVKQASGYGGGPCTAGSREWVWFCLDHGDGVRVDHGTASIAIHDLGIKDPLCCAVSLKLDPAKLQLATAALEALPGEATAVASLPELMKAGGDDKMLPLRHIYPMLAKMATTPGVPAFVPRPRGLLHRGEALPARRHPRQDHAGAGGGGHNVWIIASDRTVVNSSGVHWTAQMPRGFCLEWVGPPAAPQRLPRIGGGRHPEISRAPPR